MTETEQATAQVEIRALFATPVAVVRHPNADRLNALLKDTILQRERDQPSTHHSNVGGWQSSWDFESWGGQGAEMLLKFVMELATRLTKHREGHAIQPEWKQNSWANVNRKGHANEFHTHPGAFWSGVYYVDDAGAATDTSLGGEFEIADPRGVAPAMYRPDLVPSLPGAESSGAYATLQPVAGQALLFPSWLNHGVRAYLGDGERISVAYNLSL